MISLFLLGRVVLYRICAFVGFVKEGIWHKLQNLVMIYLTSWCRVEFPQKNFMTQSASRFVLFFTCHVHRLISKDETQIKWPSVSSIKLLA